jgi:hypothetical protein
MSLCCIAVVLDYCLTGAITGAVLGEGVTAGVTVAGVVTGVTTDGGVDDDNFSSFFSNVPLTVVSLPLISLPVLISLPAATGVPAKGFFSL